MHRICQGLKKLSLVVGVVLPVSGCLGMGMDMGFDSDASQPSLVSTLSNDPDARPAAFREAPSDMTPLYQDAALLAEAQGDHIAAANHWGQAFDADPKNAKVATHLAKNLRYAGGGLDAERVLRQAIRRSPQDKTLQLELAKTLIVNGHADDAEALMKKEFAGSDSVDVLQVHGIALDRQGKFEQAQAIYGKGLQSSNPSASLLNNAGLSFAMSGDLAQAETLLRQAVVSAGASQQEKQNLALVLSLQGNIDEARQISRTNLPQDIAQETVRFYSEMLDQPNVWGNQG